MRGAVHQLKIMLIGSINDGLLTAWVPLCLVPAIRAAQDAANIGTGTPILLQMSTVDAHRRLTVFRLHHVFGCRHLPATEDAVAQSDAQNGGCIDNDMTQRRYKTDSGQGTPCGPSDRQRTPGLRNRVFERGEVVLVLPTFCREASAWDGEFKAKLIPATRRMQPNVRLALFHRVLLQGLRLSTASTAQTLFM
jgi:hypothetical protein